MGCQWILFVFGFQFIQFGFGPEHMTFLSAIIVSLVVIKPIILAMLMLLFMATHVKQK